MSKDATAALIEAITRNDVRAAQLALTRGADATAESLDNGSHDHDDIPLLILAARTGNTALVDLLLAHGASIDAIVRGGEVIIAHHDTVIEDQDKVILFLSDKRKVAEVERLFQVSPTFL